MGSKALHYTSEQMLEAYRKADNNLTEASRILGCGSSTMKRYLSRLGIDTSMAAKREPSSKEPISLPEFPDDDLPVGEIIDMMKRRFDKRQSHQKAKNWYSIKVNMKGPVGVTFWGDPHVDDDGCDWTMLDHHCELHKATEGLFSVNIGDSLNNWSDRLARLYADQETSAKTARKLAKWFLCDSGVRWITWLMGNHDLWTLLPEVLRAQNVAKVPMEDWQAKFKLVFPNGRECRIWASHDFSGNSMWNSLHGHQKAAHTKEAADIYAAGHTHNWAIHQEESGSRDFTYWLIRSRGYKFIDDYATKLGHWPQEEGASITCVIDPDSKSRSGFIQAFADMDAATEYLKWARSR